MYKVFINEVPVFFTDSENRFESFESFYFKELDLQFILNRVSQKPTAKINVICDNLQNDWLSFRNNFEVREAAGGVVQNKNDEFLWIYRFDTWDLPKGHIEKGETKEVAAIREVEEECNVSGLVIANELETTYHVFQHKNKQILKITYWFLMRTNKDKQALKPQLEEGITEVCYKNKEESIKCLSNTYGNIKLLLEDIL